MALKRECDRCKAQSIYHNKLGWKRLHMNALPDGYALTEDDPEQSQEYLSIDLCQNCARQVEKFIKTEPPEAL